MSKVQFYFFPISNDSISFWLTHTYLADVLHSKHILGRPEFLYGHLFGYDYFIRFDQATDQVYQARIRTDKTTYFTTPVLNSHLIGFQPYCTISPQIVKDVLYMIKTPNKPVPPPIAIQRIRNIPSLWPYFPKFFPINTARPFDVSLPDVGNCNAPILVPIVNTTVPGSCSKYPESQPYIVSEQGRNQALRYRYDKNIDFMPFFIAGNMYLKQWEKYFRSNNYCSPYDTTPINWFKSLFGCSSFWTIVLLIDVLKYMYIICTKYIRITK